VRLRLLTLASGAGRDSSRLRGSGGAGHRSAAKRAPAAC